MVRVANFGCLTHCRGDLRHPLDGESDEDSRKTESGSFRNLGVHVGHALFARDFHCLSLAVLLSPQVTPA